MEVGDIGYFVFEDDGEPWLGRLRVVSLSPKARRPRWVVENSADPEEIRRCRFYIHDNPLGAIEGYQRSCVCAFSSRDWSGDECDRRVRMVLLAERLKAGCTGRDVVPSCHAVASTG